MNERKLLVIESRYRTAFLEWLVQAETSAALQEILESVKNDSDYTAVNSPIQSPRAEPLPLMTEKAPASFDAPSAHHSSRPHAVDTPTDVPSTGGTSIEALPGPPFAVGGGGELDACFFYERPSFYQNVNQGLNEGALAALDVLFDEDRAAGDASDADAQEPAEREINFETFSERVVQEMWGLSGFMAFTLWSAITNTPSAHKLLTQAELQSALRPLKRQEICDFWRQQRYSLVDSACNGADWNFYTSLLSQADLELLPAVVEGHWEELPKAPLSNLTPFIHEVVCRHKTVEFLRNYGEFQNSLCETLLLKCLGELRNGMKTGLASDWLTQTPIEEEDACFTFEELAYACLTEKWSHVRYEEFYVVYCMFFNLDLNRKHGLAQQDLIKYNHYALSSSLIHRVFQENPVADRKLMKYSNFLLFVVLDEDKTSDAAIEYWFRIMDIDGDGYIQKYEIEYFYLDQQARLISRSMDAPPVEVILSQIADMIRPELPFKITVRDIKRQRRNAPIFFNTLISLTKFLMWEHRDPFASKAEILEYPLLT